MAGLDRDRPEAGLRARETWAALAIALLATTTIAWSWVREAATSLPHVAAGESTIDDWARAALWADSSLITWILSWVPHVLGTDPLALLDGNVLHPTAHSLLGSEALLSYAVLSGPFYAATGSAVLTANLTALATYVLGGWLFYLVLRREGVSVTASAIAAAAVALGPMRAPATVHVVQFSNLFFPLMLLAFQARHRTLMVLLAALAGFLSSFYIAAMVAAVAAIELALLARREGIAKAMRPAAAVLVAAVPLLILTSLYIGYAHRAAHEEPGTLSAMVGWLQQRAFFDRTARNGIGWPLMGLAVLGAMLPTRGSHGFERARWIAITLVGIIVASGPELQVGDHVLPLPWALTRGTPLVALRSYDRFVVLGQMGVAALAAHAIDGIFRWTARAGTAVATQIAVRSLIAVGLLLAVTNGRIADLWNSLMFRTSVASPSHAFYPYLRRLPHDPLLEVPGPAAKLDLVNEGLQGDAMVASTTHWLPIINGHTRFRPWWFPGLTVVTNGLNARPNDVRRVVELTGLRWILVHGDEIPEGVYKRWQRAGAAGKPLRVVFEQDRHLLLEVRQRPQTSWQDALARDPLPGRSALGTPLDPIPDSAARATVTTHALGRTAVAETPVGLDVQVRNSGSQTWPALLPPGSKDDGLVMLQTQWQTAGGGPVGDALRTRLPLDVLPDDQVTVRVTHQAPRAPGAYELVIQVVQVGGSPFRPTHPLVVPATVTAPPDAAR